MYFLAEKKSLHIEEGGSLWALWYTNNTKADGLINHRID